MINSDGLISPYAELKLFRPNASRCMLLMPYSSGLTSNPGIASALGTKYSRFHFCYCAKILILGLEVYFGNTDVGGTEMKERHS